MKTFILKYVSIVVFFLVLGGKTTTGVPAYEAGAVNTVSEKAENGTVSGASQTSDEVYGAILDTFCSVCQVETFKLTSFGQEKEVGRLIRLCPQNYFVSSVQSVVEHNFMHLLSVRHCHGFYFYELEKLII